MSFDVSSEHVAHRDTDTHTFWLTCNGEEFARATVQEMLESDSIPAEWFDRQLREHMQEKHPMITSLAMGDSGPAAVAHLNELVSRSDEIPTPDEVLQMYMDYETPEFTERVEVMTEVCKVLQEVGRSDLVSKIIVYEVTGSRMKQNDARKILGLPTIT